MRSGCFSAPPRARAVCARPTCRKRVGSLAETPTAYRPALSRSRREQETFSVGETRQRLVGAALELLQGGGESAVSTVSVTRAAGIAQSAFYQHFANVGEWLAAAAERAACAIREAVAGARRDMYQSWTGTGAELEQFYRAVLGLTLEQRPVVELFLRYRTDPLALGGVMHRLAGDLRPDLARDLAEQVARAGLGALPPGWVEAAARQCKR